MPRSLFLLLWLALGACAATPREPTPVDRPTWQRPVDRSTDWDRYLRKARETAMSGTLNGNGYFPSPVATGQGLPSDVDAKERDGEKKRGEFAIFPVPFLNPTVGFGLNIAATYIFKIDENDSISPPSVVAAGGFYSENKSRGVFALGKFFWKEDTWRALLAGGQFRLNYDFYGIGTDPGDNGISIPLRQNMTAVIGELLHSVGGDFFLGGNVTFVSTDIGLRGITPPPGFPTPPGGFFDTDNVALGVRVQRDTRDSQFYPTEGSFLDLKVKFYDESLGSDFTYQVYEGAFNKFIEVNVKAIAALRASFRFVDGDVPFWALSLFGTNNDLRGYEIGRYRDRTKFALQAEYRYRIGGRWGAVAFAGVGGVASSFSAYTADDMLPSAGVGIRYMVATDNKVNMSLDFAVGTNAFTVYFYVGESF